MTEDTWLTTDRVPDLLRYVRRRGGNAVRNRRLRLFGCAVMRARWDAIPDDRLRDAVAQAEEYADDEFDDKTAAALRFGIANTFFHWLKTPDVDYCYNLLHRSISEVAGTFTYIQTSPEMAAAVRDIFGNPFRPVVFDKSWRTSSAIALAKTMYDARRFDAMPILSDALQDEGCEDAEILGHCRNPGAHVRGCWVVDLVLGKT